MTLPRSGRVWALNQDVGDEVHDASVEIDGDCYSGAFAR